MQRSRDFSIEIFIRRERNAEKFGTENSSREDSAPSGHYINTLPSGLNGRARQWRQRRARVLPRFNGFSIEVPHRRGLAARNKRERNFARVEYRVSKNLVGYEKSLNDNRSLDRFRLNSRPLLGREFNRCTPLGNEIYYHGQAIRQERSRTSISAQTYYEDPARDREERPSLTLRIDLSSAILYSPTTIDFLPLSLPPLYPSDYLSSSNRRGITLTNVP